METKTKIHAEDGKQELRITREFDLPVELLFKAYEKADLVEQWMGTKVLKLESKKHGSYQFETTDPKGNKYGFNGAIHAFIPNQKIIRTFEMTSPSILNLESEILNPYGIQLEVYEFEQLANNTSKLAMHVIYESVSQRDQVLQLPFVQGINLAHNRIQDILNKLK